MSCGPGTPARTTPKIICGCWNSRSSSCPRAHWTGRSSPARIPPARATSSQALAGRPGSASRSATRSTRPSASRSSRSGEARGSRRSTRTVQPREGAWVTELTGLFDLSSWPSGTRLICRRERPHPGAQLSFTDLDGHRFQCFITDQPDHDIAALEALHRQHAEVEDRVKTLKATGAAHLPFHAFTANAAWFELALTAHDIMVWTQLLTLDGEHADLRTQAAALPHPARRRADHPPRPTHHPAPARRLALGRSDPPSIQAPGRAPSSRLSTQPAPHPRPRNTQPDSALAATPKHGPSDHNKRTTRTADTAECPPPSPPATSPQNRRQLTLMTNRG